MQATICDHCNTHAETADMNGWISMGTIVVE